MKDTATAKLLLKGILAPYLQLTKASCDADLQRVETVLEKRVKTGPSLVYGHLMLKQLLQRISEQAIKNKDLDYSDVVLRTHWLGYPPATAAQISAAEKRLGVTLPDEYKSLLLITNGFRANGNIGVSYLPVEKIGWLCDLDADLVNIWGSASSTPLDSIQAAGFRRSILIGGLHEEQQLLLVPPGGSDKQWQCWRYASWAPGITTYPTLRYYLEDGLLFEENQGKKN